MSIKFLGGSYVNFGVWASPLLGLTSKTIATRFKMNVLTADRVYGIASVTHDGSFVGDWCFLFYVETVNQRLRFSYAWSTAYGAWSKENFQPVLDQWYHLAVSYDISSAGNNPKLYIDGVSQSVYEIQAPVGSVSTEADRQFQLGHFETNTPATYASLKDFRLYNRILSDAEILAIANEDIATTKVINSNGLVFHLPGDCAKGLTRATYPGATLAAANELIDRVGCLCGVPSGDPEGE